MIAATSRVRIQPGEYHVADSSTVMSTLLGSCVSACLFDPLKGIIGMNHFLLSNHRYAKDMPYYTTEAGRYGIHAMELLINEMLKKGARREHLRAKAFGGAAMFRSSPDIGNFFCVGQVNARFILEYLTHEGIPLVTSDLGGDRGRIIHFCGNDYSVYVKKVRSTANTELGIREKRFWERDIERHKSDIPQPDLWL